jgi:hypothetical protein
MSQTVDNNLQRTDLENMAWPVTRHTQMPLQGDYRKLLHGYESLQLGLYVTWDKVWDELHRYLQEKKEEGVGKDGVIDTTPEGRKFIHLPTGKRNYRYHLQFPEYHLYIAITHPPKQSPNVQVSLSAESMWLQGVEPTIQLVLDDLKCLKAEVLKTQISRCDLCVDFALPQAPDLNFLKAWMVSRTKATRHYEKGGVLETFYAGQTGAKIQLRIYDKGKEAKKNGKLWFLKLWKVERPRHVWRAEFQLLRPALKDFGIENLEDLWSKSAGIWEYLVSKWFSLRDPSTKKQNRREFHPWWKAVQDVANDFGVPVEPERFKRDDLLQPPGWYIEHIGGMLPSYSARLGIRDINDAARQLANDIICFWFEKDFYGTYDKRLLRLGFPTYNAMMEEKNGKH